MRRPSHHLGRLFHVPFLHQNLHDPAHHPCSPLLGMPRIELVDATKSFLLDLLGQLIFPRGRGGVGARRVSGGVDCVELDLLHDVQRVQKVPFRLTRETDYHVGCDRRIRQPLSYPIHDAQEFLTGVPPPHRLEYRVRTRLERHVEVLARRARLGHGVHDPEGHVPRVARHESQPLQARDVPDRAQQVTELALGRHVPPVRVNVLSQEGHLPVALRHQLPHLIDDALHRTALLDPSGGGDDAVCAALVAAIDDVDPRADHALPPRLRRVLHDVAGFGGDYLVAVGHVLEQVRDAVGILRSHDQVYLGDATKEGLALLLGDATRHDDGNVFSRALALRVGT
mmetsp:Transcript_4774/g.10249  ORF Transcript_4774/g.10249 Transcript_4774/m.10249 type:complete len:340 (-) Transcript_4774:1174-2193(-)